MQRMRCVCKSKQLLSLHARIRRSIFSASSALSDDDLPASHKSCIIQDKDLLRKSHRPSGTGLYVLDLIDDGSLDPDPSLYSLLFKKCTLLRNLYQGRIVHSHFRSSPFNHHLSLQVSLLNMFAKCGSLEDARQLFDEMPVKDLVTWTTLITGYSQNDRPLEALALFPQMLLLGLKPNEFTLSSLFKAAASGPTDVQGRQIHGFSFRSGYHRYVYVASSVLDMYAKCGNMEEAKLVFDEMKGKNEVSWNALIAGYAKKANVAQVLGILREMLREYYEPTPFTYSSIFGAFASTGSLEQGKWVHALMLKSGEQLIAYAGNTLLDMYAKSGSIEDARKVFDKLVTRDVVSWNSMLTACAQHGLGKEAIRWIQKMLRKGISPNHVSFLSVLTACSRAGLLDEGQRYFKLMDKYNIKPEISHYVTVVDLLGRAGRFDHAMKFIRNMPIEPTAAVWGALLGACGMHKNMELGAYAAERQFELDRSDSGPRVLLYNIYASAGRWTDAANVRKMMKESGVKKKPACSWVEIENTVHIFVADDDTHPQKEEIWRKWEEVSAKIKEIGYVPDTSHVLLHVDQKERETKLQHHSEKLALAFALLNTPPGSTIRIKKNIRVCGDCHSAMKLASKVVGREIIIRDTKRFHHFRDGSCSCGDYW